MEMKYWLVTVAVKTETEQGKYKKVSEDYLAEAVSVTDAEARIVADWKEAGDVRDYHIKCIRETKILKIV